MEKHLRIVHMPQVPCKAFYVEVESLEEAKKVSDVLANYDLFQYHNNIKPDFSNATFLEMFEDGEWISWMDDETGIDDIDDYFDLLAEEAKS